jgi:hypothetical protein
VVGLSGGNGANAPPVHGGGRFALHLIFGIPRLCHLYPWSDAMFYRHTTDFLENGVLR